MRTHQHCLGYTLLRIVLLMTSLLFCHLSMGHAFAPALLVLKEQGETIEVSWKTPVKETNQALLFPGFPDDCARIENIRAEVIDATLLQRWSIQCSGQGVANLAVSIDPIKGDRSSVIVRVEYINGAVAQTILGPSNTQFIVPVQGNTLSVMLDYLMLGVKHLATGFDHMLFLAAIVLLVGITRRLIGVISCFTLGHALTLSAAALGYVSFPQQITEMLIAASLLLAYANLSGGVKRSRPRQRTLLIVAGFGLLHGLGFAGALSETGLPAGEIPAALVGFNLGIEVGQLILIAGLALVLKLLDGWHYRPANMMRWLPLYTAGCLSGFWFWQRLLVVF